VVRTLLRTNLAALAEPVAAVVGQLSLVPTSVVEPPSLLAECPFDALGLDRGALVADFEEYQAEQRKPYERFREVLGTLGVVSTGRRRQRALNGPGAIRTAIEAWVTEASDVLERARWAEGDLDALAIEVGELVERATDLADQVDALGLHDLAHHLRRATTNLARVARWARTEGATGAKSRGSHDRGPPPGRLVTARPAAPHGPPDVAHNAWMTPTLAA